MFAVFFYFFVSITFNNISYIYLFWENGFRIFWAKYIDDSISAGFRTNEALCKLSYEAPYLGPEGGRPGMPTQAVRHACSGNLGIHVVNIFKIAPHKQKSIVKIIFWQEDGPPWTTGPCAHLSTMVNLAPDSMLIQDLPKWSQYNVVLEINNNIVVTW